MSFLHLLFSHQRQVAWLAWGMIIGLWPFAFSCRSTAQTSASAIPYLWEKPERRVELADELLEISGLALAPDGKRLLAVQDEHGIVYELHPETMQILRRIEFVPEGDFEGIAIAGDTIYVVKSSGTLYRIVHAGTPRQQTDKVKAGLTKAHDVEGLTVDLAHRRLLLACKAAPPEQLQDEKHVYALSLPDLTLDTTPVLRIRLADMVAWLQRAPASPVHEECLAFLTRPERAGTLSFSPSGIAIHPQSGHYYVLSAAGRMLAVYSPEGRLQGLHRFDKTLLEQPEGICFDARGRLYIASEGKRGKPVIVVFKP